MKIVVLLQFDNVQEIEQQDDRVGGIELVPFDAKVGPTSKLVVVVVVAFAKHQEVEGQQVFGRVVYFEAYVAKLVGKPIDDGAVYRPH